MLYMEQRGLLREPLMYLSAYLKQHQSEYYRRLSAIRGDGDWEGWVSFFREGVAAASADAERSIIDVASLITADRKRRRQAAGGSRHPGRAHWAEEEPRLQLPGLRGPALPVTGASRARRRPRIFQIPIFTQSERMDCRDAACIVCPNIGIQMR